MCVSLNQYCSGVLGTQYHTSSSLVHITAYIEPTMVDLPKVPLNFAIFRQTLDDTANNGKTRALCARVFMLERASRMSRFACLGRASPARCDAFLAR